jgi:hypothetical protein
MTTCPGTVQWEEKHGKTHQERSNTTVIQ